MIIIVRSYFKVIIICLKCHATFSIHHLYTVCVYSTGPPLISLDDGPVSVRVSTTMTTVYLHCPFIGNPLPVVFWFDSESGLLESEKYRIHYNGTLEISDYTVTETARYRCNVTNKYGTDSRYYGFQLWGE